MLEVAGGLDYREIDKFVVTLSASSNDHIMSYTGAYNISVITLGYQLHCHNSEDCPNATILPQSQSMNIDNYKHHYVCTDVFFAYLIFISSALVRIEHDWVVSYS